MLLPRRAAMRARAIMLMFVAPAAAHAGTFGDDGTFLRAHTEVVVL